MVRGITGMRGKRILAVMTAILISVAPLVSGELLGNVYLQETDFHDGGGGGGDGESDPGQLDVDEDYVWANTTNEERTYNSTFSYVNADPDTEDLHCYDYLDDGGGGTHSDIQVYYGCDDDYALRVADPLIALQAAYRAREPPCDDTQACLGSIVLIPVFGEWSGRADVTFYQNGSQKETNSIDFPLRAYGLVKLVVSTSFERDYSIKTELYQDGGNLIEETSKEEIRVVNVSKARYNLFANYTYWSQGDRYLYAAGWQQKPPQMDTCAKIMSGEKRVNSVEAHGRETDAVWLAGDPVFEPTEVQIGPFCSNIKTTTQMTLE